MPTPDDVDPAALDAFIERWNPAQAAELANAQPFLIELAALLGVPGPEPATKDPARDGYVFDRSRGHRAYSSFEDYTREQGGG